MPEVANVIARINQSVEILSGGRYHEAVNTLTEVLAQVKAMLTAYEKACVPSAYDPFLPCPSFCCFLHLEKASEDTDSGSFLCRSPIIINAEQASKSDPIPVLVKLSYVVLYNLALTYHLGALSRKPCKSIFRRALGCYQMAHDLQLNHGDADEGALLSLIIANNIGQIHGFVGNAAKAKQCFQHLLSTIMYMTDCGGEGSSVPSPQLDGFMRNIQKYGVLPTSLKKNAPAA